MRFNRRDEDKAEVSMSPLIDCVFLLLIFFLVATMLKKKDKDISISLPDSASAVKVLPSDDVLVVGINEVGDLYWEGVPSSLDEMHNRLRELAVATPGRRVRLDVDKLAPFHRVAEVLDALQFRGLNNVGIRTYDRYYNRKR